MPVGAYARPTQVITDRVGARPKSWWGVTPYQWTVLFAAWLGWGFDVFDGLLFNYVAPNCVPTLLGLQIGSEVAKKATFAWTGILSSMLLIGWGVGGLVFGRVADRIGRSRTLIFTMLLYAAGTALCAVATNIGWLVVFRVVASLGIGGEWAAGAAMVAEVMPEKRRVEAGALLYTSAPFGLFLATFLTYQIQGRLFAAHPEVAWRYLFACGLLPAAAAFIVRRFVREPERWTAVKEKASGGLRELLSPALRVATLSGFAMAFIALVCWWSCNAFIPVVASGLAQAEAKLRGLNKGSTTALVESWKALATNSFNVGGLLGTLLTIPAAKYLGRRTMYLLYYLLAGVAIMATFGLPLPPHLRLYFYFWIGLTVFGVFGSFTFYLPELFPTRLRATGAGACYNGGRFVAALGPYLVGTIVSKGANAGVAALHVLFELGWVPLAGLFLLPWVVETKGRQLSD